MTGPLSPEVLHEYARQTEDGRWWFSSPLFSHSETAALAIVEACRLLQVPVTDTLTTTAWLRLVDKVIQLEERLSRLEQRP